MIKAIKGFWARWFAFRPISYGPYLRVAACPECCQGVFEDYAVVKKKEEPERWERTQEHVCPDCGHVGPYTLIVARKVCFGYPLLWIGWTEKWVERGVDAQHVHGPKEAQ